MSKQLGTAACAIDWLLALLFTQAGMFFVGKTHADVAHGIAPHELAFGMSGGNVAALALILAASLVFHGLWCWRKFRAPDAQARPKPVELALIVAVPLLAIVVGVALGVSLA